MRAPAELVTLAADRGLMHEVRHVQHQQDRTGASEADPSEIWRKGELSCDPYATQLLLDGVDGHAAASGSPAAPVRRKREVGIYPALFAMVLIGTGFRHPTRTPPAMERGSRMQSHSRLSQHFGWLIPRYPGHSDLGPMRSTHESCRLTDRIKNDGQHGMPDLVPSQSVAAFCRSPRTVANVVGIIS